MEHLSTDPVILLSVVNTKLRDVYPSLAALCEDLDISEKELTEKLGKLDYQYSPEKNRFV